MIATRLYLSLLRTFTLVFQLRDCDLGAIVNRELKQRVRLVNGITGHKQVLKADIKNAAKIIQNMDKKFHMWDSSTSKDKEKESDQKEVISINKEIIF